MNRWQREAFRMNDTRSSLGIIAPALLNPGAAAVIAVGLVGYGLIKLLGEDEEDEGQTEVNGSITPQERTSTVAPTVDMPLGNRLEQPPVVSDTPLEPIPEAIPEPFDMAQQETELSQESDADRQNMIRQYMSELGKRSAAARAKKRASDDQTPHE